MQAHYQAVVHGETCGRNRGEVGRPAPSARCARVSWPRTPL